MVDIIYEELSMKGKEMYENIIKTASHLRNLIPDLNPEYLIIMGSGLKDAIIDLKNTKSVKYTDIPNFPPTTVKGHEGELLYGNFGSKNVVIMRGRFHYYEGHPITFISFPLRLFHYLGVRKLIVTAAVGSLKKVIKPGDIVLINDHINLMLTNPLIGNYYEKFGDMFVDMSEVYSSKAVDYIIRFSRKIGISCKKGVYIAVSGPCYETKAEAKMYKMIGGDIIGMSVVPEVIAAKQLGMEILGISWVSNYVPGISKANISHDNVLELGKQAGLKIRKIIEFVIKEKVF